MSGGQLFFAVALPPLLPAFFFWAVVPPCEELLFFLPDPLAFPPRLDEPSELAILAARDFDIPLSLSASYCFSFFTLARVPGMASTSAIVCYPGDRPACTSAMTMTGCGT
jgi:hypothetical protein